MALSYKALPEHTRLRLSEPAAREHESQAVTAGGHASTSSYKARTEPQAQAVAATWLAKRPVRPAAATVLDPVRGSAYAPYACVAQRTQERIARRVAGGISPPRYPPGDTLLRTRRMRASRSVRKSVSPGG